VLAIRQRHRRRGAAPGVVERTFMSDPSARLLPKPSEARGSEQVCMVRSFVRLFVRSFVRPFVPRSIRTRRTISRTTCPCRLARAASCSWASCQFASLVLHAGRHE
jgi:hypothetical protein